MAGLGTSDGKGAGGPSPFYTEARARTRRISSRPAENDCLILSIRNAVLSIISAYVHICTSFPLSMFHQTPLSSERRRPEPSVYHVCTGWMSTNISVLCSYVDLIYHVSTNLNTPPQPESNYPSGKIFFSPISSPPCSALSFRFCVTSQLYTLAVATSSVCSINLSQQSEHAVEPQNADNHRNLFPQKIQVFLTRLQAVLRNTELRL